jgi:hypothetical protein
MYGGAKIEELPDGKIKETEHFPNGNITEIKKSNDGRILKERYFHSEKSKDGIETVTEYSSDDRTEDISMLIRKEGYLQVREGSNSDWIKTKCKLEGKAKRDDRSRAFYDLLLGEKPQVKTKTVDAPFTFEDIDGTGFIISNGDYKKEMQTDSLEDKNSWKKAFGMMHDIEAYAEATNAAEELARKDAARTHDLVYKDGKYQSVLRDPDTWLDAKRKYKEMADRVEQELQQQAEAEDAAGAEAAAGED